ncbi:DeoR/GlpR family DNA-binding transcription regulator [Tessaracoccus sp.]
MIAEVRQRRMAEIVNARGSASVTDLVESLEVSEATVRRDLDDLASRGLLERVRGGACRQRSVVRPEADRDAFAVVAGQASEEKRRIGRIAVEQIQDGDVVALDVGTTVFAMCEHLRAKRITVVTASLAVVRALSNAPSIDLVVMGGVLRSNYESMVGVLTESCLRQVRVDVAFLGTAGVRPDGSVLDSTPSEVPIKRAMLDIATRSWLLADHQKFPGSGLLAIAPLFAFTGLVTDTPLTDEELTLSPDSTLEVLTA